MAGAQATTPIAASGEMDFELTIMDSATEVAVAMAATAVAFLVM